MPGIVDYSGLACPEPSVFVPGREYLVQAGAVWVGPGRIFEPGWVRVLDGRVVDLGQGKPPESPGSHGLDLGDLWVTPAWMDAHVHLNLDAGAGLDLAGRVVQAANWGLAGVRDGGDRRASLLTSRPGVEHQLILAASGVALYCPGRYGSFIGRGVRTRSEMEDAVREMAESGADQIKILASGPVLLDHGGRAGAPQFAVEDLVFLVSLAHDRGLPLMAHANGPEAVKDCLVAGVDSIEHGYLMGHDNLARLADADVFWVPTIFPLIALKNREADTGRKSTLDRLVAGQSEQLARAVDLGVRVVLGSDAGSPGVEPGPGLWAEVGCWVRAGVGPLDILSAATSRPAEIIPRFNSLGHLAPGRPARLVGFLTSRRLPDFTRPPAFSGRPASGGNA